MQTIPLSRWTICWRLKGYLIWGLLILVALIAVTFALTGWQAGSLQEDRLQATATITKVSESKVLTNDMDTISGTYKRIRRTDVDFTFTAQNGQIVKGSHYYLGLTKDMAVKDQIPLWYAAASPETYELAVGHKEHNTSALRIIALIIAAPIATALLYWPLRQGSQVLRVRDGETRREATVLEPTKHQIRNGNDAYLLWKSSGANAKPGKSRLPVPQDVRPKPGQTIQIIQQDDDSVWQREFGPPRQSLGAGA